MQTTPLPKTDLIPSSICFGTSKLGVNITEREAIALLDAFVERGGNFIDTARMYSNRYPGEKNRSERILGDWMRERKNRDHLVLATKGGHPDDITGLHRLSPAQLEEEVNGSLKTLRTDWIDLYWLHRDDPNRPAGSILEVLHAFQKAGKIRYYACSNWSVARIQEADRYSQERGYSGFVASQIRWNLGIFHKKPSGDRGVLSFDRKFLDLHRETRLPAIPFSSQAKGYFTKLSRDPEAMARNPYHTPGNLAIYAYLNELAESSGLSLNQLVLAYLWSQPFPVIPIFGSRNREQLEDTLGAVGHHLPEDALDTLDRLVS